MSTRPTESLKHLFKLLFAIILITGISHQGEVLAQCTPPPSSLVSWWSGDNNALDRVGGNNGTLQGGATFADGKVGQSFSFDGVNGYIDAGSGSNLKITGPLTIDAWFKTSGSGAIVSSYDYDDPCSAGTKNGFFLYITGDGLVLFQVFQYGSVGIYDSASTTAAFNDGVWHHAAAVFPSNGVDRVRIYVDGILQNVDRAGSARSNSTASTVNLTIGAVGPSYCQVSYSGFFSGFIDELEIYNRALSDSEIAAIYNVQSAGKCRSCTPPPSGLVSWWGGDNNALDMVGSFNGMLNGATFAPGMVGQAFSLDGVDDHVNVGDLDLPSTFTIDAWIKPAAIGNPLYILTKDNDVDVRSYYFAVDAAGDLILVVRNGSGGFTAYVTGSVITAGQWSHVAVVYDGNAAAEQKMKFYLNGQALAGSVSGGYDAGGTPENNSQDALIGALGSLEPGSGFFNGLIDEVEIYNRGLSDSEIGAIYDAGNGGKCRSCTPPPSGLASWWSGDNNAFDLVGGNTATLQGGTTFADGKVGRAFSFNGTDAYVEVPDSSSLHVPTAITLDAWINTANPSADQQIMAKVLASGNVNSYSLSMGSTGYLYFEVDKASGGNKWGAWRTNFTPSANTWYHVAATWQNVNGGATDAKIYINGAEQTTQMFSNVGYDSSFTLEYASLPLYIGRDNQGNYHFNGLIDEVEIINRVLSADEIAAIYNAGSTGKCRPCIAPPSGLVSWWGGDNNALDMVGGYNGTLMHDATFASGKVGQAFSFDGVDDYVTTPNVINEWADGTVDLWVKFNTVPSETTHIFAATTSTTGDVLELYYSGGNFGTAINSGGWHEIQTPVTLVAGQWYHLAVSWGSQGIKLYVNGISMGTDPTNYTGPMPPTEYNSLGAGYWTLHGSNLYLNGLIDEVEIYNRALSASEIAAIYNAGSGGKCRSCTPPPSGMISWWKGDNSAVDAAGTNHGTLMNGVTFAPGKVGQAFSLSGAVDDYVEIPNSPILNPSTAFSIDGWFYIDPSDPANAGDISPLVAKSSSGSAEGGWFLVFDDRSGYGYTKSIRFSVFNGVPGEYAGGAVQNAITTAGWYHLTGTFEQAANPQAKLYVNGSLAAQSGCSPCITYLPNTIAMRIGAMHDREYYGGTQVWRLKGLADEIEFFNRVLSEMEIQAIYNAGSAGKCFTPDTTPDSFTFAGQTDVALSTLITSNSFTVSGINTGAPISVTGGYYEINGSDTWTNSAGTVYNGNTVRVRQTSSSNFSTQTDCTLTVGGVSGTFSVTTLAADTTPDAFSFTAQTNVARSTLIESNSITVTGIDAASGISITAGGEYSVSTNGGTTWSPYSTTTPSTVGLDDRVKVRQTSSSNFSTQTDCTLTVGGVSGTFSVTTLAADTTPDAFSFTAQTNVARSTVIESNSITVTGINAASGISITAGGEYSISANGGTTWSPYSTTTPSTVELNDRVKVRQTSSSNFSTQTDCTLTIGGVNGTFSVTTGAGDLIYVSHDDQCGSHSPCFTTIQQAVNSAAGPIVVRVVQGTFSEDIVLNNSNVISIHGGWDASYTTRPGFTIIIGSITIRAGTLIVVERIVLQ